MGKKKKTVESKVVDMTSTQRQLLVEQESRYQQEQAMLLRYQNEERQRSLETFRTELKLPEDAEVNLAKLKFILPEKKEEE